MAWWDVDHSPIKDKTHPWFRGYKPEQGESRYEKLRRRRKMTMEEFKAQFHRRVQKRLEEMEAGRPWDEWDLDRK